MSQLKYLDPFREKYYDKSLLTSCIFPFPTFLPQYRISIQKSLKILEILAKMSEVDSNWYYAFKVRDAFTYDLEILRNYRNFLLTLCFEGGSDRKVAGGEVGQAGGVHAVLMDLFIGESWNELATLEESEMLRRVWEILDITMESFQKLSEGVDAALRNCVFFKEWERGKILRGKEEFILYLEKRATFLGKCYDNERRMEMKDAKNAKEMLFEYLKVSSELIRKNDRM